MGLCKSETWFLALISTAVWYVFTVFVLYAIKNEIDIFVAAFLILVLGITGFLTCPLLGSSTIMVKKKK